MERKKRVMITLEMTQIIIRMSENEKLTIKNIAEALNLNRHTVSNVLKKHSNGEVFIPANENLKKTIADKNNVFSPTKQFVFNSVVSNNAITQSEVSNKLSTQMDVHISQPTISRIIKNVGLTRKRLSLIPAERNSGARIEERVIYASLISRIALDNLLYLDETGLNEHNRRSYGYSIKNTKAYQTVPANRGINKSVMCVIGRNGMIAYEQLIGSYNTERFIAFIQLKILPYCAMFPNKVIVMDNCRFHHSASVATLFRENNIVFHFLPAYSPQLNPIEEFFSMMKARFRSVRSDRPTLSIPDALESVMMGDFTNECQGFFRNMSRWLERARLREIFI